MQIGTCHVSVIIAFLKLLSRNGSDFLIFVTNRKAGQVTFEKCEKDFAIYRFRAEFRFNGRFAPKNAPSMKKRFVASDRPIQQLVLLLTSPLKFL